MQKNSRIRTGAVAMEADLVILMSTMANTSVGNGPMQHNMCCNHCNNCWKLTNGTKHMLSNNCDSIPDIGGIISGGVVVDPEGELSGNALRVTLTLVVLLTLTLTLLVLLTLTLTLVVLLTLTLTLVVLLTLTLVVLLTLTMTLVVLLTLTLVVLLTLTLNTGSESATTLVAQHWYQL